MIWINPIELFHLENEPPKGIDKEAVAHAVSRLKDKDGEKPVIYRGQALSEEQINAAARELGNPEKVLYYHRLCQYPELNHFLAGYSFARIEAEALKDEQIAAPAARQLQQAYDESLLQALENGRAAEFAAFVEQVEKGGETFQNIIFEGKSTEQLEARLSNVRRLAEQLEKGEFETSSASLRQLSFLREQAPVDVLNALPARFAGIRDAFAETLVRIVEALRGQDLTLALGVARHTRRLRADKALMERLNQDYHQLGQDVKSTGPGGTERPTPKWLPWAWAGAVAALILAIALLIYQNADRLIDALDGLGAPGEEQSGEHPVPDSEALPEEQALGALSRKLAEGEGISREELERIIQESGGETQVAEPEFLLQLPWRERGTAFPGELSGEAGMGEAPMLICFPPEPPSPSPAPVFTVIGDQAYDAIVFFFNGRRYFQQAYIPAKSKFQVAQNLNTEELVSTMVIFGQEWSPDAVSPCGTPGYFTKNIFYGGFAAYATDPPYLNLHRDGFLQLKKNRLMPSRELEEGKFFDILEEYR